MTIALMVVRWRMRNPTSLAGLCASGVARCATARFCGGMQGGRVKGGVDESRAELMEARGAGPWWR